MGRGLGGILMRHLEAIARSRNLPAITLEADAENVKLVNWYRKFGFEVYKNLNSYFAPGKHAVRMRKTLPVDLPEKQVEHTISNIIVVDTVRDFPLTIDSAEIIVAQQYLTGERFQVEDNFRIFNLSDSYHHHKLGYYISLLASARNQKIIPNVITLRDFSSMALTQEIADDIQEVIQKSLKDISEHTYSLDVLFGQTQIDGMEPVAAALYLMFEALLFKATFVKNGDWSVKKLELLPLKTVLESYSVDTVQNLASQYFQRKRFKRARLKNYHYDMAILTNPEEKTPPSCPKALKMFKAAANAVGFYVEFITKRDFPRIAEFDHSSSGKRPPFTTIRTGFPARRKRKGLSLSTIPGQSSAAVTKYTSTNVFTGVE